MERIFAFTIIEEVEANRIYLKAETWEKAKENFLKTEPEYWYKAIIRIQETSWDKYGRLIVPNISVLNQFNL